MADVFKNTEMRYGGGFSANVGIVQSVGGRLDGTLMQNLQWQYAQQANQLYELGRAGEISRFYYVSGRASGTLGVGHIIGPGLQLQNYYRDFSDVCNAGANIVETTLRDTSCNTQNNRQPGDVRGMRMKFCILVSVGMGAQVPDLQIREQSQLMFGNAEQVGI